MPEKRFKMVVEEHPRVEAEVIWQQATVPRLLTITLNEVTAYFVLSGRYAMEGNNYRYFRVEPVAIAPELFLATPKRSTKK